MKKVKEMVELVHMQQLNSMARSGRSNKGTRPESEILAEAVSGAMSNAPPPPPEGPAILQLEDQQTVPNIQINLNPPLFARFSTTAQVHSLSEELNSHLTTRKLASDRSRLLCKMFIVCEWIEDRKIF